MGLGGAGQPSIGVGGRRPGALHEHLEADFVQQGAVDVVDPHQVLDASERAVFRPVRHDVLGYFLRDASDAHELRRGGGVNVHPSAGLVIQIFAQRGRGMLGRTGPARDAYFQFDYFQFGGPDPAHQSQVLHLFKPPDTVPVLDDILRNSAVDSRQSHEFLLGGRVDVQPLLVHQNVAEVTRCAEFALAAAEVVGVLGDGAVAAQTPTHSSSVSPGLGSVQRTGADSGPRQREQAERATTMETREVTGTQVYRPAHTGTTSLI